MNDENIMLSIKILAYNHEKYISKCIDSILSQKTEYAYEILIGEDCSSDGTKRIIEEYEKKYPDIIKVIYHEKNCGCTKNAYALDVKARGKYLAGCEGDDYWCDEYRIQKDVSYLEKNPQYVGVCHKVNVVDGDDNPISLSDVSERVKFWYFEKEIYTLADYESWRMPGHGCAMTTINFFRRDDCDYSIVYRASTRVADRTHLLICAIEGDIICDNDIVATYRYVTTQNNYMSIQKKKNFKAEEYAMMLRLEEWAAQVKGKEIDLTYIKNDRFVGAVTIWLRDRNSQNLSVVKEIIGMSHKKMLFVFYFFKIIITKLYFWKIKKTDSIIRL